MLWQIRPTLLTLQWYTCHLVKENLTTKNMYSWSDVYGNRYETKQWVKTSIRSHILAGYTCDKADKWRFHWVVGSELAVQLKHSFLIWRVRGTLHENPPECWNDEKSNTTFEHKLKHIKSQSTNMYICSLHKIKVKKREAAIYWSLTLTERLWRRDVGHNVDSSAPPGFVCPSPWNAHSWTPESFSSEHCLIVWLLGNISKTLKSFQIKLVKRGWWCDFGIY